jgi:hypothetical protein
MVMMSAGAVSNSEEDELENLENQLTEDLNIGRSLYKGNSQHGARDANKKHFGTDEKPLEKGSRSSSNGHNNLGNNFSNQHKIGS